MPVIIIAEAKGQTQEGMDGMYAALADPMRQAPGLILHTSHRTEEGWRVIELWQSKAEGNQWFAKYVAPNLPPGVRPKRTFHEPHILLMPESMRLALEANAEALSASNE